MSGGNVNMKDLPEELTTHILSLLDAESILACADVNAAWNKMTDDVDNKMWFEVCLKAGIYVEKDKFEDATDWKKFLSSMLRRLKAMKDSTCFSTSHYAQDHPITAIYCHNEKIALAFGNRIEIRKLYEEEILNEFQCNFEPAHLKFDDKILVAASRFGIISSWSATTGNFLSRYTHEDHNILLTCFDFLTNHNIVASSYLQYRDFTSSIYIGSTSSDNMCRVAIVDTSTIGSVMLAPNRDHPVNEQEITCYVFGLTINYVTVFSVTLQNRNLSASLTASLRIPHSTFGRPLPRVLIDRRPWGLLFDGKEVYIMTRFPPFYSRIVCAWNLRTHSLRYLKNDGRITNLLGVGEKYIAYEIEVENNFKRVVVASKITAEILAIIRMHRSTANANDDHLCLANTSWLDGINGQNDLGFVCARIADDKLSVYVTQFVPRNG